MKHIHELHEKAMDIAELAFVAKLEGNEVKADQLFREAFTYEAKAAKLVPNDLSSEPTHSVLFRSAASLALDCNEVQEAEKLVAMGLAGDPPEEIAEELRDLLERVNFQRHLDLHGISLKSEEIQMSIAGHAIGFGIAPSDEFVSRVEQTQRLISRTVERLMGKPYREGGSASSDVKDYRLFLSVPRPASFAISLKVAGPKQPSLPLFEDLTAYLDPIEVIDEVLNCLQLFNQSAQKQLREKIPQPAYYRNFVGLAKNIAPDGSEVTLIGFTTVRNGVKQTVDLTHPRDEIELPLEAVSDVDSNKEIERITITGRLLFADATHEAVQTIRVIDQNGKSRNVIVQEGMMSDIVKPLWEELVTVSGFYRGKAIVLEDIRKMVKMYE